MVRRVCRELGNKKNIMVFNDEAHHYYRRNPDGEDVHLCQAHRLHSAAFMRSAGAHLPPPIGTRRSRALNVEGS